MRGFTLLETLMYIALFGIVMSGGLAGVQALTESANRSQTHALLETEGSFLMKKIQYEITSGSSIREPSSSSTSSELSILTDPGNLLEIYLANTALSIRDGDVAVPLSTDSVSVSNLSFLRNGSGGLDPESIAVSFEISSRTSEGQNESEMFSATTYLFPH